jgi:hypothetical protein
MLRVVLNFVRLISESFILAPRERFLQYQINVYFMTRWASALMKFQGQI